MLPSNLLVVWKRKGEILPRYAKISTINIEAAVRLIETYSKHVGEKKKTLRAAAIDLENEGFEYRLARGLALLLERRGNFTCNSKINPVDLRRKLFETTAQYGLPTTPGKRRELLENVARESGFTMEEIEENLYSDLDEELILERFDPPSPVELLRQYNMSLTQTLLFDSTELTFTVSGNWQNLFYQIKKLDLIYEVYRQNGFNVKIDGPASLFKLTRRYGINIAKLFPLIVANPHWSVNAKVLWKYTNEICSLKLESQKHSLLLPEPRVQRPFYDSAVEEEFSSKFNALKSSWILKREPEPVQAGNSVIIPDFSLERSGLKIYVEIVGFWTEEYLLRKAEKIKQVKDKMILLVDEDLACEKLAALEKRPQLQFIYYHGEISLAPVLRYLEKAFEEVKATETQFLQDLHIKFTEPIVQYAEFANRVGVSVETVRTSLTANPPAGYFAMPNNLISKEKLEQVGLIIEECLRKSGNLALSEVIKVIEAEGLGNEASSTLSKLGYKIKWAGLDPEKTRVYKA